MGNASTDLRVGTRVEHTPQGRTGTVVDTPETGRQEGYYRVDFDTDGPVFARPSAGPSVVAHREHLRVLADQ